MAGKDTTHAGKYEIEKFTGKNDFGYWRSQMKDVLISQKLHKALRRKPTKPAEMADTVWEAQSSTRMLDEDGKELDLQACTAIRLYLARDVQISVREETTAVRIWQKLEDQYMIKNLTNRLYQKIIISDDYGRRHFNQGSHSQVQAGGV